MVAYRSTKQGEGIAWNRLRVFSRHHGGIGKKEAVARGGAISQGIYFQCDCKSPPSRPDANSLVASVLDGDVSCMHIPRVRIGLIFNPSAQGDKARNLQSQLDSIADECTLMPTEGPGHAEDLAEQAVEDGFEVLVAGGGDGTVHEVVNGVVRHPDGLNQVAVGAPLKHTAEIRDVAISAAGPIAITAGADRVARLWDTNTGRPLGPPLEHADEVVAVALSESGQIALTGSLDDTARLWTVATGKPLGPPLAHAGDVVAVALSRDGQTAVTGSRDHTARLWNVPQAESRGPALRHAGAVLAVAISDDARLVVTASGDDTCRFWEGATGRPVGVPKPHDHAVVAIAVSGNAAVAVSGSLDGTARVWRAETDRPLGEPLGTDGNAYRATGSQDGQITLEHEELDDHVVVGVVQEEDNLHFIIYAKED